MSALISKYKSVTFFIACALSLACMVLGLVLDQKLFFLIPFGLVFLYFFSLDLKIAFGILLCSIPFSFNPVEFGGPSIDLPVEPMMILLLIVSPFLFIQNMNDPAQIKLIRNPIVTILFFWYLWMVVCTFNSTVPELSIKFILAKLWYFIPLIGFGALLFIHRFDYFYKLLKIFLTISGIAIIIILYRHSKLGFSFEDVNEAGAPVFRNHVLTGAFASMIAPIAIACLWLTRRFTWKWIALVGLVVLCFGLIYFSYSRGAWAAIFFAGVAWFFLRIKKLHWLINLFYAGFLGIILWLSHNNRYIDYAPDSQKGVMHESLMDHLIATVRGKDISSNERFYRWIASARLSRDYPIAGTGPNTFYENYKSYRVLKFRTWVSRNPEHSTTHNYFLFTLVEQGYVGLFFYSLFIWYLFYYTQKVYNRYQDKWYKTMVAALAGVFGAFLINNSLSEFLENDKIGGMFLMGVGLLIALDIRYKLNLDQSNHRDNKQESLL